MFALENLHLSTNVNQSLLQTMISGYLPVVGRAAIRNISIVPLRQAPASPFSFRIAFLYAALLKKKNQQTSPFCQGYKAVEDIHSITFTNMTVLKCVKKIKWVRLGTFSHTFLILLVL